MSLSKEFGKAFGSALQIIGLVTSFINPAVGAALTTVGTVLEGERKAKIGRQRIGEARRQQMGIKGMAKNKIELARQNKEAARREGVLTARRKQRKRASGGLQSTIFGASPVGGGATLG